MALDPAGNLYATDVLSLSMVVLDPAGNPVGSFDVTRPYGQPKAADRYPGVTSLAPNTDGSMLALRPALTIDILKLQSEPLPSPEKPPTVSQTHTAGH